MFVYELYGAMIHSGGSYSGHYYAYIKDFESGKWHKFNDTAVSEISVLELLNVLGVETKPGKASRLSSGNVANAYMLMYRIVGADPSQQMNSVHESEIADEVREDALQMDISEKAHIIEKQERS